MEEKISLNGIIDMHVHTAPDVCQRTYNDLELTAAAVRAGARAIVIKGHHCSTVARAALCNAYNRMAFDSNSFVMYGGLVLNYEVGGLNPQAVQTALEMGAKVIWLPTVDAENDCRKHGRTTEYCFRSCAVFSRLSKNMTPFLLRVIFHPRRHGVWSTVPATSAYKKS